MDARSVVRFGGRPLAGHSPGAMVLLEIAFGVTPIPAEPPATGGAPPAPRRRREDSWCSPWTGSEQGSERCDVAQRSQTLSPSPLAIETPVLAKSKKPFEVG